MVSGVTGKGEAKSWGGSLELISVIISIFLREQRKHD